MDVEIQVAEFNMRVVAHQAEPLVQLLRAPSNSHQIETEMKCNAGNIPDVAGTTRVAATIIPTAK